MQLVIAEKPSVGMALAKALGVSGKNDGFIEGENVIVSWCVGHLVGLANADMYDEKFKKWNIADLPIVPENWQFIVAEDKNKQFGVLRQLMEDSRVTEVVNACDAGREGELIFRLVYDKIGCTSGNVTDYEKLFDALKEVSPVPIKFAEIDGSAKGFFHQEDKSITIKEGMSEAQTVKTAIHEIAHAMLHDKDLKKSDLEKPKDRATEEVEAESIAYTVCQHFGVDTSDYSFAYVASWGSGKDTPELKASLETIRSTASELITQISDKYLGIEKDKTQEKAAEAPEQPKKSNIIGNVEYSAIEDKQYFRLNSDTAQKVAEKLTEQNVPFSGRINGDKTTLTITLTANDWDSVVKPKLEAAGVYDVYLLLLETKGNKPDLF